MNPIVFYSIIQIIAAIACIVFIFIGLRIALKQLNKDDAAQTIAPQVLKKSTLLIVIGIVFFAIYRFAENILPMQEAEYDVQMIFLQSLWQAVYSVGFTALIPLLITKLQSSRLAPPEKE